MIASDHLPDTDAARLVLAPNRSATWRDNLLLAAAVGAAALPVAIGWSLLGFWPILPLCGLELAALLVGLYLSSHSLLAREVVTIDDDNITIEAGKREIERRFQLSRHWARVVLVPARKMGHPRRLIVRSHGRAVELGRFLTDEERAEVAARLREMLAGR